MNGKEGSMQGDGTDKCVRWRRYPSWGVGPAAEVARAQESDRDDLRTADEGCAIRQAGLKIN
jgi:hypothetical protein